MSNPTKETVALVRRWCFTGEQVVSRRCYTVPYYK
jgi:hypothetical protein